MNKLQDDFGDYFTNEIGEVIYDTKTIYGPWARMTQNTFVVKGLGKLELGYGQKYVRVENNRLEKVEG